MRCVALRAESVETFEPKHCPYFVLMKGTWNVPLIKPPRLKTGDTIGIVSPAGPVRETDLEPGLSVLESSGYRIRLGDHVYDTKGYLAGEDSARLSDLHAMITDPEITAVFCARGGYGSIRLLDMINYDLIREHPKILVGYSDITALLTAIHGKTGLVTFHGPMVRDLEPGRKRDWDSLRRLLGSDGSPELKLDACGVPVSGSAKGHLIGGNLSMICHLLGTPFMPHLNGGVLFLEDKGEALYRVDRMLMHLFLSGCLKGITALISGRFEGCGEPDGINRLFLSLASRLGVPLVTGFPLGHGRENLALPMGTTAELDTKRMTLTITEACVA